MNVASVSPRWHTLVATVENKPGVLARVAGLFSRRGFNIHSLAVAPTDDERFSRITFTVDIEGTPLDQVVKQLDKLINVVDISELDPAHSVERELMLIKVRASGAGRAEILRLVDIFRGRVLDVTSSTYVIELTGTVEKLDAFIDAVDDKSVLELARSGAMGIARGERSLRI